MVLTKKEELSGSGLASLTGYGSADEPEEEGKKKYREIKYYYINQFHEIIV